MHRRSPLALTICVAVALTSLALVSCNSPQTESAGLAGPRIGQIILGSMCSGTVTCWRIEITPTGKVLASLGFVERNNSPVADKSQRFHPVAVTSATVRGLFTLARAYGFFSLPKQPKLDVSPAPAGKWYFIRFGHKIVWASSILHTPSVKPLFAVVIAASSIKFCGISYGWPENIGPCGKQ